MMESPPAPHYNWVINWNYINKKVPTHFTTHFTRDGKVTFTRPFLMLGKVTFDEQVNVLERYCKGDIS